MMTRREVASGVVASSTLAATVAAGQANPRMKPLPAPRRQGGMPLMSALERRRSIREYAEKPLELQILSDLLWAAFGVNRPSGDRTAPYWRHVMVIDVLAAMADGVWLYDPKQHALLPHLSADIRAQ